MEKKTFETVEEYSDFLSERFYEINNAGKYNVFLHAITNYTPIMDCVKGNANEDIKLKVKAIIEKGFYLPGYSNFGAYGSMNGTSKFIGEINSVEKFNNVVDYHYDNNQNQEYSATLIMTVPKYIDTGDQILELSSVEGDLPYRGANNKQCIYDVVKGEFMPKSFNLGIQIVNNKTKSVVFLNNDEHISTKSEEEQNEIMKEYVDQIARYTDKYAKDGSVDWQLVFRKETFLHEEMISDFYYDID